MTTTAADPPIPDWNALSFRYVHCRAHLSFKFNVATNSWPMEPEIITGPPQMSLHLASTAIHYGQSCFEGLKAFTCRDGKVRIFRPDMNAARMQRSAAAAAMPPVPVELFVSACLKLVQENRDYVPPYGSGGALYLRPFLFGAGGDLVLGACDDFRFTLFATPVGDYYRSASGFGNAVPALVVQDFDRAAPRGTGSVKLAGNYAAAMPASARARALGYPATLFLDALTQSFVEEFSTSNFIGITREGALITPKSDSILRSVTRISLCEIAEKLLGMSVEERPIPWNEVAGGAFVEVAACGTAVVVTPISRIHRDGIDIPLTAGMGPVTQKLYTHIRAIQQGEAEDTLNWMCPPEGI